MKKNNAFALAEILLTLALVGVLIGLLSGKVLRQMPDIEKTRVKKAYVVIEKTIFSMTNNDVLYPGDLILRNLEPVITTVGDQFGVRDETLLPNSKFRDSFMYYMSIAEENISCDILDGAGIEVADNCFKTSDGTVYGIPDTNFESVGVVEAPVPGAAVGSLATKFAPITVYPSWNDKKDYASNAIVVGVRFDGKIQILNNDCRADSEDLRCKIEDILESDDIKRNR